MDRIQNKHGPDFDVEFPMTGQPRDGTERNPRDGTEGNPRDGTERRPRDGTERRPRDGTERRPRDKTILWKGSLVSRYYYRKTEQPQDVQTYSRPSSKWRTIGWGIPALWTGQGEVCPYVNENEH